MFFSVGRGMERGGGGFFALARSLWSANDRGALETWFVWSVRVALWGDRGDRGDRGGGEGRGRGKGEGKGKGKGKGRLKRGGGVNGVISFLVWRLWGSPVRCCHNVSQVAVIDTLVYVY